MERASVLNWTPGSRGLDPQQAQEVQEAPLVPSASAAPEPSAGCRFVASVRSASAEADAGVGGHLDDPTQQLVDVDRSRATWSSAHRRDRRRAARRRPPGRRTARVGRPEVVGELAGQRQGAAYELLGLLAAAAPARAATPGPAARRTSARGCGSSASHSATSNRVRPTAARPTNPSCAPSWVISATVPTPNRCSPPPTSWPRSISTTPNSTCFALIRLASMIR